MSKVFDTEFKLRVQNLKEHLDTATQELWDSEYPNFPQEHPLKKTIKAALIMELNNLISLELILGEK